MSASPRPAIATGLPVLRSAPPAQALGAVTGKERAVRVALTGSHAQAPVPGASIVNVIASAKVC